MNQFTKHNLPEIPEDFTELYMWVLKARLCKKALTLSEKEIQSTEETFIRLLNHCIKEMREGAQSSQHSTGYICIEMYYSDDDLLYDIYFTLY